MGSKLTRLGMVGAGLMMAVGAALLSLSAAPQAAAGSCTSPNGGTPCTPAVPVTATASTATVASSTTLTLSTASITFPNVTSLPIDESASTPVSGSVASNDTSGWSVDIEAVSTPGNTGATCGDFVGNSNAAPVGSIDDFIPVRDLQVTGSAGTTAFVTSQSSPCGQAANTAPDTGTGAGTISDTYVLSFPADTANDTFTTTLDYTIIGN